MNSMKKLALATVALAGLGLAGTALATCPASPVPPWSANNQLLGATAVIAPTGLHSTACGLYTKISASGLVGASTASVQDTSPNLEARYRFRLYVNAAALGAFSIVDGVRIVNVLSAPGVGLNNNRTVLGVSLVQGTTGITLSFAYACNNGGSMRCSANVPAGLNLLSGDNVIEFDIQTGNTGTIRYWVNSASATEPAPTATIGPFDNSAWSVDQIFIGMLAPATPNFIAAHHDQNLIFDEFDSRRQTYIGP